VLAYFPLNAPAWASLGTLGFKIVLFGFAGAFETSIMALNYLHVVALFD